MCINRLHVWRWFSKHLEEKKRENRIWKRYFLYQFLPISSTNFLYQFPLPIPSQSSTGVYIFTSDESFQFISYSINSHLTILELKLQWTSIFFAVPRHIYISDDLVPGEYFYQVNSLENFHIYEYGYFLLDEPLSLL